MSVADHQTPTVLIDKVGVPVDPVLNFRVNGLSQKLSGVAVP